MAQITLPEQRGQLSWLDRPLAWTWQRTLASVVTWERAAYALVLFTGFLLRIWDVGSRALHHDESLHAYYAWKLFVGQGYAYDPLMHGPLQFEVVPVFYALFGDSEFSARLLAVILGTVMIILPYALRRYLTPAGALMTAVFIAVSPSLVYFSRFIRDDIYLACFTLLLFIALVHYLARPRPVLLYVAAAAMALGMASMEAAYITFFIFGTFLIFQGLREMIGDRDGPVLSAVRATSADTWLTALSIFVIINVLLYSTFFTNPYGIWDTQHSLLSPDRRDILGGLTYWKAQHYVQRGGQPWFYYLLVIPLYEQVAVLFGLAGVVYFTLRRSLVTTFLVWWAVLSLGTYSWAGEKMPWLSIHITLPLLLLAGALVGQIMLYHRRWLKAGTVVAATLLLGLEAHSTFALNFVDGANPTEMLIYVQTSQDVPSISHTIAAMSQRLTGGNTLQVGLDSNDVGGWPFTWYLRNYPNVTETASFNGPVCGGTYCPVLLVLQPEFDPNASLLMKHYVAQKFRWNWWFPEDYKIWFPQHWGAAFSGQGPLISDLVGSPSDWHNVWNWLAFRRPFDDRGARWAYFLIRRDLVPDARAFSTAVPGAAATIPQVSLPSLPATRLLALQSAGGTRLADPRGMAFDQRGNLYVAEPLVHRIVVFDPRGSYLRSWGTVGTGPGQFSQRDSPQAVAIGPDGLVYTTDTWNQRIEVFGPDGAFVRQWGGTNGPAPGQFYGPRSIAADSRGRVYVADTGNKRIQVFDNTGRYLRSIGTAGTAPGQFQEPSAVAVGPDGLAYVADFWNRRIQVFNPAGSYVRSWSVPDWTFGSYDEPFLAVNPRTGTVFAADPQQQRVLAYTPAGSLLGSLAGGQFTLPIGVAVSPSGHVSVGDATAGTVYQYAVGIRHAAKLKIKEFRASLSKTNHP